MRRLPHDPPNRLRKSEQSNVNGDVVVDPLAIPAPRGATDPVTETISERPAQSPEPGAAVTDHRKPVCETRRPFWPSSRDLLDGSLSL